MATKAPRWPNIRRRVRRLLWLAAMLSSVGCQQPSAYQASSLPPDLIPQRESGSRHFDLSRIAQDAPRSGLLFAGDVIQVSIATGLEREAPTVWKVRLDERGVANIPLVGPVALAGLDLPTAEAVVREESIRRGKFVHPNVTVLLESHRTHRITLVGAVAKPGTYEVPAANADLLTALVAAGGLAEDAGSRVEIRRAASRGPLEGWSATRAGSRPNGILPASHAGPMTSGPPSLVVDLADGPGAPQSLWLDDGSTVMVAPRAKRYVHVMGLVRQPDQFELPDDQDMHLLDALALAGGRTTELADTVRIIRPRGEGQPPAVIEASVEAAKRDGRENLRLAAGDTVSVEETPATFVVGVIRDFVRFGFTAPIPGF